MQGDNASIFYHTFLSGKLLLRHCEPPLLYFGGKAIPVIFDEIAHLHCNTPALAGGARERSAAQVSGKTRNSLAMTDMIDDSIHLPFI